MYMIFFFFFQKKANIYKEEWKEKHFQFSGRQSLKPKVGWAHPLIESEKKKKGMEWTIHKLQVNYKKKKYRIS